VHYHTGGFVHDRDVVVVVDDIEGDGLRGDCRVRGRRHFVADELCGPKTRPGLLPPAVDSHQTAKDPPLRGAAAAPRVVPLEYEIQTLS
jgi:hypothetical protein